jgi:RHS repeat-associated protein
LLWVLPYVDATGCSQESGLSSSATTKNQLSTYGYDAAGNVINIPAVASYTGVYPERSRRDAENHLLSTAGVTYSYDGDGKRVMKSNGKLYWYGSGSEPVIETDAAGNFQYRYLYFAGMRVAREEANDWVDHYVNDALGNARIVYGLNGGWDWSDYYPFGGERVVNGYNLAGNHFKFTGKERDTESGLDDFEARYHSSSMGRFMSADWSAIPVPVPYANLTNPQTLNLYAIVHDNPVTFADLDGHDDARGTNCVNSPSGSSCQAVAGADAGANPGRKDPAQTTQLTQNQQQATQQQEQPSQASAGLVVLPLIGRAIVGAEEGATGGAVAGTVEPGGGNVAGAVVGAVVGAAAAALAPTIYSKSKDAAKKAASQLERALEHLGPTKLGGPDQRPRQGWKQTVRDAANQIDKHADRIANEGLSNAAHLTADLLRGLVD